MLRSFRADFHIHTCLSPCTDFEMSPQGIVDQVKLKRIDIIGICDHNSSENVMAVINAAKNEEIKVLPGMEVTSREEVHILGLFDEVKNVLTLQEIVYRNLYGENKEDEYGMQIIVNEKGEVLGFNKKLLISATILSIEEVIRYIHFYNGIAIASHIDREAFSIIGQLGFIPDDLELDGLEISPKISYQQAKKRFNYNYPFVCSSDAHYLDEIGKGFTSLILEKATVKEIKKALRNEDGRRIVRSKKWKLENGN
ncbi:MAG: PHP domain-containing protein [Candidatus Aminicenantia bacterium]